MTSRLFTGLLLAAVLFVAPHAQAQDASNSKAIPQTVEELKEMSNPAPKKPYERVRSLRVPAVKHSVVVEEKTIRVSPSESKTVSLSRDAASVIVANPMHATVFLDSPRMLVIMPRAPGATEITVLDDQGEVVLNKGILVSGAGDNHVRVRRICDAVSDNGTKQDCERDTIYYCPDGNCEKVVVEPPIFKVQKSGGEADYYSAETGGKLSTQDVDSGMVQE